MSRDLHIQLTFPEFAFMNASPAELPLRIPDVSIVQAIKATGMGFRVQGWGNRQASSGHEQDGQGGAAARTE